MNDTDVDNDDVVDGNNFGNNFYNIGWQVH